MREVALYDPNRKPRSWMEVIQPTQYAVFVRDVETGAELTSDGHQLEPRTTRSCLIFDSLEEAKQYCCRQIEITPELRCDVFDSHGRANPPIATFVNRRYESKLESEEKASRMMRWAGVLIASSVPLFWHTWKTRGEGWIAAFFGVQLVVIGLRLLLWGCSMKEELRSSRRKADLRRKQNATHTGGPRI